MIIDVTGFGWSGSGAVHDLLREYGDLHFAAHDYDWEFPLLWMPDGIYDLEHKLCVKHCRYGDSEYAIKRFLALAKAMERESVMHCHRIFKGNFYQICENYIDDLTQVEFEARGLDEILYPDFKEKLFRIRKRLFANRYASKLLPAAIVDLIKRSKPHAIRLSYNPDNFVERTQDLLDELLSYVRPNNKHIPVITDQLFPPDCPNLFFKYIKGGVKCIVVRRDPRDLYLLAKNAYNKSSIPIPVKKVEDFIIFYKKTIKETKLESVDNVLNINFEDLIYNYDVTKQIVENFVGAHDHQLKLRYFDPQKSIMNTQLYNMYDGFEEDIRKIENALSKSLFPFEKYQVLGKNRDKIF